MGLVTDCRHVTRCPVNGDVAQRYGFALACRGAREGAVLLGERIDDGQRPDRRLDRDVPISEDAHRVHTVPRRS